MLLLSKQALLACLLAFLLVPAPLVADGLGSWNDTYEQIAPKGARTKDRAPLEKFKDKKLQKRLEKSVAALGLKRAVKYRKLAVALVDITQINKPRVALLNGNKMMYAASLPKIAILLAVFEKIKSGHLRLNNKLEKQLLAMIRRSSNRDSTALMQRVGNKFIATVLASNRYRLYDPLYNGGLWAGKDYGKSGLWRRDPLHNLSHGATPLQVARFYYLLETGNLVSKEYSRKMKRILAHSAISHKFIRGLKDIRPEAVTYRKSGSWSHYHSDSAIVERDGASYIAVGLADSSQGGSWLTHLIIAMDGIIG